MGSGPGNRSSRYVAALGAALLLTACGDAGESASSSSGPLASAEATATAIASDTPDPTPSPSEALLEPSAYGSRATVATGPLRVRQQPRLSSDVVFRLEEGTEVRLMEGPVAADGFNWYYVSYGSQIDMRYPGEEAGWMAESALTDAGETVGDPLLEISEPVCPASSVDAPMLAELSLYAIDVCDVQADTLQGLIDQCIEGPITPWKFEPEWAWFSCQFLRDEEPKLIDSEWFLNIAFPPEVEPPQPGDVVTLHGQIGFDEAQYGECVVDTVEPRSPDDPVALDAQQQLWEQQCQLKFVVSDFTVDDQIELEPPI